MLTGSPGQLLVRLVVLIVVVLLIVWVGNAIGILPLDWLTHPRK